jgi:hypothetical protein
LEEIIVLKGVVKFDFDYQGDLDAVCITVNKDGQEVDQEVLNSTLGDKLEGLICNHAVDGQEVEIVLRLKKVEDHETN